MNEERTPRRKAPTRTAARASARAPARARAEAEAEAGPPPSQAVVIIHGMGEQRPMDTIRGFVRAVWSTDLGLTDPWPGKRTTDPDTGREINRSWIVPDRRTGSHELRRITTPGMKGSERRTDFYELYWADLMRRTPLRRLLGWLGGLLLRPWSQVPGDAVGLYLMAWAAVAIGVLPTAALWWTGAFGGHVLGLPNWAWAAAAWLVSLAVSALVLPYLGDVADYVRATPDTVRRRAAVRRRGLELLSTLNADPAYDRIVLVGHSLGSVIAYDLLQILWAECGPSHRNPRPGKAIADALKGIGTYALPLGANGAAGKPLGTPEELARYRRLQWRLFTLLRSTAGAAEKPWKISDFVTVGSPLTHAGFLIARDERAFARAVEERLFATCPPTSDKEREPTIVYKAQHAHHASVFAATRWTNIHDRGNSWCTGDPFSGPVRGIFGPGVADRNVRLRSTFWRFRSRLFTHTFYWADAADVARGEAPHHIAVLREALDLRRSQEG